MMADHLDIWRERTLEMLLVHWSCRKLEYMLENV